MRHISNLQLLQLFMGTELYIDVNVIKKVDGEYRFDVHRKDHKHTTFIKLKDLLQNDNNRFYQSTVELVADKYPEHCI